MIGVFMKILSFALLTIALSMATVSAGESLKCKESTDELIINKDTISYITESARYMDVAYNKTQTLYDGTYIIETKVGKVQGLGSDASFVVFTKSKNQKVTDVQVVMTNVGFGNSYGAMECAGSSIVQTKTK
jgi:ABC-type thiamin/hydroxymethylpyrimidine transport system permease subunit